VGVVTPAGKQEFRSSSRSEREGVQEFRIEGY